MKDLFLLLGLVSFLKISIQLFITEPDISHSSQTFGPLLSIHTIC